MMPDNLKSLLDGGGELIAVALVWWPFEECSPMAAALLHRALSAQMQQNGINAEGCALNAPGFVTSVHIVADRNEAFRCAQRTVRAMELLPLCRFGFYDQAEGGNWREVFSKSTGAGPFEIFVSEAVWEHSRLAARARSESIELLKKFQEQQQGGNQP